ncbi:MAG: hypothetical protein U5K54_04755 [Cytophagales bacterium]|nr:hypothetical protein [Cytophagales bacterium]
MRALNDGISIRRSANTNSVMKCNYFLALPINFLIGSALLYLGLNARYRYVDQDRFNNQVLPDTGGAWLFVILFAGWHIRSEFNSWIKRRATTLCACRWNRTNTNVSD